MKIALVSPMTFLAAVIIGVVLAIAISPLITPHPVETPKIEIPPVPTPAPVYIQPTATSTPYQTDGVEYSFVNLLPLFIVAIAVLSMLIPIFLFGRD